MRVDVSGKKGGALGSGGFPDPSVRLAWLDALKVVAAFAVITTHIASIGWQAMSPSADGWLATSFYEIATRFAVPAFFMTSGALLLNPRRAVSLHRIIESYVPRTVALALFVSFLYCALERVLNGWMGWRSVLTAAFKGPYFIWYLWVLVALYIVTPLLRLVCERDDALSYALVVLGIFVIAKSTVETMLPGSWIVSWLENFSIFTSGMGSVFYYLLGAWLISHNSSRIFSYSLICAGIVSLAVAVALNYESALSDGANLNYVARNNLLIAIFAVGVFEAFRLAASLLEPCAATFGKLAGLGMGIYLIHPFFRLVMEELSAFSPAIQWLLSSPTISIPAVSAAIWVLSACASAACTAVSRAFPFLLLSHDRDLP